MIKKFMLTALALLTILSSTAYAEYVNGYTKKNGTYVSGYNRSDSNSSVTDNYSFKGNTNPYTGSTGTNYYRNSPSSPHYGTSSSNTFGSSSNSSFSSWGNDN